MVIDMKVCVQIIQNDDGNFTAVCPSLPGCLSRGTSREEAYSKLEDAIRGYLAAVGNFVPERVTHEIVEA